jgi:hypothetical protein
VKEELTEAEKELLDKLDREHQEFLKKTDPDRIFEALLQNPPTLSPEQIQSVIEESRIVEKIISVFKEELRKTNTVLLVRQMAEGLLSNQEKLWGIEASAIFIIYAEDYVRTALLQRLYFQVPLVLSEALSYASGEYKTTSEQRELEQVIAERGRSPHLPLRDPRGRNAVINDEELLRAFQTLGSSAPMTRVAELLDVGTDALKKWRRRDKRKFKSWKEVQKYFAALGGQINEAFIPRSN